MAPLRQFAQHRVQDGVLLRLIGKWLNAGVMESEQISYPEAGSPLGGVISPLLANVYLHWPSCLAVIFLADSLASMGNAVPDDGIEPRRRGRPFGDRFPS